MLGSIKRTALTGALLAGITTPALLAMAPAAAESLKVGVREYTGGKGNPFSGAVGTPGIYTWSAVYEQLTQNGVGGVSMPLLATGWKKIDPATWEFKLVTGKFANGEVINAAAVKVSYDWRLKTDAGKNIAPFIADVMVVDN